ncbi:pilus assembly protein [Mesorhizobium sp. BAC0120]|uniref:pilus assembly protein n=1 Tax=Mesorhizobium sp. BAC0120 TaxID=3090670 RepID=UPI00298CFCB6|nr:pilus assembly protein [Mesorhizobium sp. BAC0120]MDW6024083.1 pilus assembly protein [Mesorhizobium sp. BAC0120]
MRKFLADRRGNYALMTAVAMVPLMGAVAMAVDYSEMNRQKQAVANALDAAGIATARQVVTGASDDELKAYAKKFFEANLSHVKPADTALTVTLPTKQNGGGTLKLAARLNYKPLFFPAFATLIGQTEGVADADINFTTKSEIRLKNTLEVALVLDNSGSMDNYSAAGQKRIELLKAAAKQLVSTLADQAKLIKQVNKPVQFSLVPFAASVNVGPQNAGASWIDIDGLSPIHHENFDWTTLSDPNKRAEKIGGIWYKKGSGWGGQEGETLTRFALYQDMKVVTSHERVAGSKRTVCDEYDKKHVCTSRHDEYDYIDTYGPFASWQGCVEARPYPYNVNDAPASGGSNNTGIGFGDPASMFVPMFAPDEPGNHWKVTQDPKEANPVKYGAANSWWNDDPSSTTGRTRETNMAKYFMPRPIDAPVLPAGAGPNYSCTTEPITPLTDVTTPEGLTALTAAIDRMKPNGNTNVPEGLAWGWRTVSHGEPFTEGRPDNEKGNDKVVIVLTDGANTYSVPSSDPAGNKSTYAAYGYLQPGYNGGSVGRLLLGTSAGQFNYTNSNYTAALDDHLAKVCANAKAANVLVMTVSLDLSTSNSSENKAIQALTKCASDSRFRKDAAGKPAKLFWNATGSNLAEKFKEIADELSNLRIVG